MYINTVFKIAVRGFLCIAIFIMSGCLKEQAGRRSKRATPHQQQLQAQFACTQARLTDIPIPIQVRPVSCEGDITSVNGCTLRYQVMMERQALLRFYLYEMERMGWQCLFSCSDAHEEVRVFDKPERMCTLSIRAESSGFLVVLSMGLKAHDE